MSKISSSQVQKMSRGPGISSRSNIICRETLEHINACRAVGSNWSYTNAFALDRLIRRLMREGLWSRLSAACIGGADTLPGMLTPLRGPAPSMYNFTGSDYSRVSGLRGNTTNKWGSLILAESLPPADISVSVWKTELSAPLTLGALMGAGGPVAGAIFLGETQQARLRNANTVPPAPLAEAVGFHGASRASASSYEFLAPAFSGVGGASDGLVTGPIFVFARQISGAPATFAPARLAWWHVGLSLDLSALRAALADYFAALV